MSDPSLALLMDRFTRRVHLALQAQAGDFDTYSVGPGGGMLLMLLDEVGPVTMQDLAKQMVRDKSQMTRMIASMDRKGLTTRSPGTQDSRQIIVALTPEGARFVQTLRMVVSDTIDGILAPLPAQDRTHLRQLLAQALL